MNDNSITGFIKRSPFLMVDTEEFNNENRIICSPSDYVKMAESGQVKMYTEAGIKVIQSGYCEDGKMIFTGPLAIAIKEMIK